MLWNDVDPWGDTLATITTQAENEFVTARLKKRQGWIGASDKEEEGV